MARQLARFREQERLKEIERQREAERQLEQEQARQAARQLEEQARQAALAGEQARFREQERLQEIERQREAARQVEQEREREAALAREQARLREQDRILQQEREAAERQREIERQRDLQLERDRLREVERQREQDRLRIQEQEQQQAREREQQRQLEQLSRSTTAKLPSSPTVVQAPVMPGTEEIGQARLIQDTEARIRGVQAVTEAFNKERFLRERNEAMTHAFEAVPGGPESLVTINSLLADSPARTRSTGRGGGTLSREAEERLFEAGLADEEAAVVAGPPSVLREVRRKLDDRTARERELVIRDSASKIPRGLEALDSFREEGRQREQNDLVGAALRRVPGGDALVTTLEQAAEAAEEATKLKKAPTVPAPGRGEKQSRSLDELRDRNAAFRDAFGVVEGGDLSLTAIDELVAGSLGSGSSPNGRGSKPAGLSAAEERLFEAGLAQDEAGAAAGPPSILREVQEALAAETAAERERLSRETAAKIPMGLEAFDSFREE